MNCDDYLSLLETLPVDDLAQGRPREHTIGCHECERVTRLVAERERNMLIAFDDLDFPVAAAQTAATALTASRRRKVAIAYNIGLGVVTAAVVLSVIGSRMLARSPIPTVTETFRLQCLSPEQAGELLRPYMRASGRILLIRPGPLGVIDVAAPSEVMATARSILERYDTPSRSQCAVQITVPHVP
jgi:hypothetical protein